MKLPSRVLGCSLVLCVGAAFLPSPVALARGETFLVTNTKNGGRGSLRSAINRANEKADHNLIRFRIGGSHADVKTIRLTSELPAIEHPVTINGYTQKGASPMQGCQDEPELRVELNGLEEVTTGLTLESSGSSIRGLVLNRFAGDAIRIGDPVEGARNEVFKNNKIRGNHIGTDAAGERLRTNGGVGVRVVGGARSNVIGGARCSDGNLISGNAQGGVFIGGLGTDRNRVQNNYIGTDRDGNRIGSQGPQQDTGVIIQLGARFNRIGAAGGDADNLGGNTIAFHEDDGVLIGGTNMGATDETDANPIRFNSIHSNGGEDGIGLGINFDSGVQGAPGPAEGDPTARQPFGVDVTANDQMDGDTGPNNEQNHPILTSVTSTGDGVSVEGELAGEPDADYVIDVYANRRQQAESDRPCNPSDRGEGEVYLGSVRLSTDSMGVGTFSMDISGSFEGELFTATATKRRGGDETLQPRPATSEFSPCAEMEAS